MNKILTFFFIIFLFFIMFFDFFILRFGNYYNFYSIPVLHDGRIKPLGTLADYDYKLTFKIDGSSNINSFAKIFFNPSEFLSDKILAIKDIDIKNNLGLKNKNIFNVLELADSFQKNSELINNLIKTDFKILTESQKLLLNIYSDVSLILETIKYMDLITFNDLIYEKFDGAMNNKYEFLSSFNDKTFDMKNENIFLEYKLFLTDNNEWFNLNDFFKIKNFKRNLEMDLLNDMANSFNKKDFKLLNEKCLEFKNLTSQHMSKISSFLVKSEVFYNKLKFILKSCFYFLICVILIIFFRNKNLSINFAKMAFFFGVISLFSDLFFRILLTQKSPVTSLNESLIFVNFVFTLYFLINLLKFKNSKRILASASISFLLSLITIKLSDASNIKLVVAVLNTNFWLVIHVLTISIGYGFCLICGFLGHIYIYQLAKYKNYLIKNNLYNYIFYFTLLSLFFSFIGTLLGGIWADQSWGRFWGWDPKENGALLIVLWLTLILHAKSSNLISEIYFVVGSILNLIVLSLAWFGVNLLSVGLHSYGFIENIGIGLFGYVTFELLFLIYFIFLYKKNLNVI